MKQNDEIKSFYILIAPHGIHIYRNIFADIFPFNHQNESIFMVSTAVVAFVIVIDVRKILIVSNAYMKTIPPLNLLTTIE